MKKIILLLFILSTAFVSLKSQVMRSEELEKYAKEKYGEKWLDAAKNLSSNLSLDKNNSLTYTQVIECEGKTKEQIYITLNHWFVQTFNDANSVIKLNDKESGVIIGKGYVPKIASHTGGVSSYSVNISPIIKTEIKDGKARVTYTIQYYEVVKTVGGGGLMVAMSAMSGTPNQTTTSFEKWPLEKSYPFIEKDKNSAKNTSSKALVMAHAYSNVIMDKIEEAIKNGLTGNENESW